MYSINYETHTPYDIMQILKLKNDRKRINDILDLWIFKVNNWTLSIPSIKVNIQKNEWKDIKSKIDYFPFAHQIFLFELLSVKDLDFAISETKRILKGEKQYLFPNGTLIIIK